MIAFSYIGNLNYFIFVYCINIVFLLVKQYFYSN